MLGIPNLPFFIGNDICHVARIKRILKGRLATQFVRRILRREEIQHESTASILRCIMDKEAGKAANPQTSVSPRDPVDFTRAVEFMAGRFAAKEAVIKAHPYRRLTFQRITIARMGFRETTPDILMKQSEDKDGAPIPQSGPLVALIEGDDTHAGACASVSISHDTDYATAVCLAVNPDVTMLPRS